jgi:hypothetical protein
VLDLAQFRYLSRRKPAPAALRARQNPEELVHRHKADGPSVQSGQTGTRFEQPSPRQVFDHMMPKMEKKFQQRYATYLE